MPQIKQNKRNADDDLLQSLIRECGGFAKLAELIYSCTEPEMGPIIRAFAAVPKRTRAQIGRFLAGIEPRTLDARADGAEFCLSARSRRKA